MSEKKVIGWFTSNGKHIPIYEGESKQDALNRSIAQQNEEKKNSDIEKSKKEADKLNKKKKKKNKIKDVEEAKSIKYEWLYNTTQGAKFFEEHSNYKDWKLDEKEEDGIYRFTGNWFGNINGSLYRQKEEDIPDEYKGYIEGIKSGLSKFELRDGVEVTRNCDFKIFGSNGGDMTKEDIRNFLAKSDGIVQNDGFMSFCADNEGVAVPGMGKPKLVIHLRVPPSKGAGAFVQKYSRNPKESEFLLNNNAILWFDVDSMDKDWMFSGNKINIVAYWLGQADKRTID